MKEIYVAVSGAVSREKQLAMVTNNLANINAAGYKRQTAIFEVRPPQTDFERLQQSADEALNLPPVTQRLDGDRNYVRVAESYTDFSQGILRPTERRYDMALETWGETNATAFFTVQTPDGPAYTRMGDFTLNSNGELTTPQGHRVLNEQGTPIKIGGDKHIEVADDGSIQAEDQKIGKIAVAVFSNPQQLQRIGHSLYSDRQGTVKSRPAAEKDNIVVRAGYLELSNVNAVEELVRMIEVQRSYGAFQKVMTAIDETSGKLITTMSNQ